MDNEQWLAEKNFVRIGENTWQQLGCADVQVTRHNPAEDYEWRASVNSWLGYGDDVPSALASAIEMADAAVQDTVIAANAARGLLEPPSGTDT